MSDESAGVFLPIPLPDDQIFRYQAADDILELLYHHPHRQFTVTELRDITEHGGKSVDNAINILEELNLIKREKEGRRSLIKINRENIRKPDDQIMQIPQEDFREPISKFLKDLNFHVESLAGVILFGSVARGEADRASDIDLFILVDDNAMESRRQVQEVVQEVENETFDGDRYEFQAMVEDMRSAKNYGPKLKTIFSEGIPLYRTPKLDRIKEAVFDGE